MKRTISISHMEELHRDLSKVWYLSELDPAAARTALSKSELTHREWLLQLPRGRLALFYLKTGDRLLEEADNLVKAGNRPYLRVKVRRIKSQLDPVLNWLTQILGVLKNTTELGCRQQLSIRDRVIISDRLLLNTESAGIVRIPVVWEHQQLTQRQFQQLDDCGYHLDWLDGQLLIKNQTAVALHLGCQETHQHGVMDSLQLLVNQTERHSSGYGEVILIGNHAYWPVFPTVGMDRLDLRGWHLTRLGKDIP